MNYHSVSTLVGHYNSILHVVSIVAARHCNRGSVGSFSLMSKYPSPISSPIDLSPILSLILSPIVNPISNRSISNRSISNCESHLQSYLQFYLQSIYLQSIYLQLWVPSPIDLSPIDSISNPTQSIFNSISNLTRYKFESCRRWPQTKRRWQPTSESIMRQSKS